MWLYRFYMDCNWISDIFIETWQDSFSRQRKSKFENRNEIKTSSSWGLDNCFDLGHQFLESIEVDILDDINFFHYKSGSPLTNIVVFIICSSIKWENCRIFLCPMQREGRGWEGKGLRGGGHSPIPPSYLYPLFLCIITQQTACLNYLYDIKIKIAGKMTL